MDLALHCYSQEKEIQNGKATNLWLHKKIMVELNLYATVHGHIKCAILNVNTSKMKAMMVIQT